MKQIIDFFMNNKDKLDIEVLDEQYFHERIQIFFKEPVTILCDRTHFFNIESIIYNSAIKDVSLCLDDEFYVGNIGDADDINLIFGKKTIYYNKEAHNDK